MKPTPWLLSMVPLACVSLAAAQPAGPGSDNTWAQSQRRDPADSYTFTHFTLLGRFVGSAPVADHPTLTVDCIPADGSTRAKFLAANLLVGKTLKIDWVEPQEIRGTNYFPKVAVEYRIDDAHGSSQQEWAAGTDRIPTAKPSDKASASVPKDAVKRFLRAHTVTITTTDEHGGPLEMRFDIPDSAPVKAACNVDE